MFVKHTVYTLVYLQKKNPKELFKTMWKLKGSALLLICSYMFFSVYALTNMKP